MANSELTCEASGGKRAYFVFGSGLFPVPRDRIGEIPALKVEHHEAEAKRIMLLVMARRVY